MKCLKNEKTGNIIRVTDTQAYNMVGSTWSYVPKSEWKTAVRKVTEKQETEETKKEETVSEKALRRKKLKTKQRPLEPSDNLLK